MGNATSSQLVYVMPQLTCLFLSQKASKELCAVHSNFRAQTTETGQNHCIAMDSNEDNGRDCAKEPETHNLAEKNMPTHTKYKKNNETDRTTEPPKNVENPVQRGATNNPQETQHPKTLTGTELLQQDQLNEVLEPKAGPPKLFVAKQSEQLKEKAKEPNKKTKELTKVKFLPLNKAGPHKNQLNKTPYDTLSLEQISRLGATRTPLNWASTKLARTLTTAAPTKDAQKRRLS